MDDETIRSPGAPRAPVGRTLLQQELIRTRALVDRQVGQLVRANRVSDLLARTPDDAPVAATFAEAIVDVLDVPVGAAWLFAADGAVVDHAVVGAAGSDDWTAWGPLLAAHLADREPSPRSAVALTDAGGHPEPGLADVIVCPVLSRTGVARAIVVAADSNRYGGMPEPVDDESLGTLTLLAEKFAAHLDGRDDRRVIIEQTARVRDSEERLALVLRGTNDGWFDWEIDTGRCFLSARWLELVGRTATGDGEYRTGFWFDQVHPHDSTAFQRKLRRALAGDAAGIELEVDLSREDGSDMPVLVRASITRTSDGHAARLAGTVLDLTERKRHEAYVHHLAFYDPLTDLPNRRLLGDRIHQALVASMRHGHHLAVVLIDIDRFKLVNDVHGHVIGDRLLTSVAKRLRSIVRGHDTVARLSGDEFVVLLEQIGNEAAAAQQHALAITEKMLDVLRTPHELEGATIQRPASAGVVVTADTHLTIDELLQRADVAMYEAKTAGSDRVSLFRPEMQEQVTERVALEDLLHEAVAQRAISVAYQAQVDGDGRLTGAEALMRWHPADGDPIPPAQFIPVAEETGLIVPLGRQLLAEVCGQLRRWEGRLPPGFRVACNLASAEILDRGFVESVLSTLAEYEVPGSAIRFEITEATALRELDTVAERIRTLARYDIECSLDDFGTGYSSLTYLRRLPVRGLKIDQSYVRQMLVDEHDAAITRAIIALGDSFGLHVVAEGVETRAEHEALRAMGCRAFQGYRFGRPQFPGDDPDELLARD